MNNSQDHDRNKRWRNVKDIKPHLVDGLLSSIGNQEGKLNDAINVASLLISIRDLVTRIYGDSHDINSHKDAEHGDTTVFADRVDSEETSDEGRKKNCGDNLNAENEASPAKHNSPAVTDIRTVFCLDVCGDKTLQS